jgi:hypothetical protein
MAYIGTSPSNGVRRRFVYEATASQTSFSGNDENGITLTYVDSLYLDVYQNGVKLKAGDDYTATTGTTVVLAVGASANDVVEMVAFDVFSVNDSVSASDGGSFAGNIGMGGTLGVTGAVTLGTKLATTNLATGAVVQVVNVVTGASATGTTALPTDDTIPQKTEGIEVMTLAITPTSASNKLFIQVTALGSVAAANKYVVMALFQDDTANALSATFSFESVSTGSVVTPLNHFMTSGTTSETTFKVRMGSNDTSTFTFNGDSGNRLFGGVANSSITITEIAV